ncbi:MAG TPA: aminodeoxychorismate/anthranilate synthase component II [Vicinamibacteria bacterium]|jgi:anthranilate synthase/aminodeoxychorismate synthase-like glutamine amidotransferase
MSSARVLVLDNRDSFVFNLVDEFRRHDAEVATVRSNMSLADWQRCLNRFSPDLVVLSPGPGRPEEAGVMVPWLRTRPELPILGVCLGHQALAIAAGGRVERAPRPVHGRKSLISVGDDPVFDGLPLPLVAARYHSLVVTELPDELEVVATTRDEGQELVMAIRHRSLCQIGLQFHPESILTPGGGRIVSQFLREALAWKARVSSPVDTAGAGSS